jgi:hypothetical protein
MPHQAEEALGPIYIPRGSRGVVMFHINKKNKSYVVKTLNDSAFIGKRAQLSLATTILS